MELVMQIGWILLGCVVGVLSMVAYKKVVASGKRRRARSEADRIISKAKNEAAKVARSAKDQGEKIKKMAENEINKAKQNIQKLQSQLKSQEHNLQNKFKDKERSLEEKMHKIEKRAEELEIFEKRLKESEQQNQEKTKQLASKLENVSGMTVEQAKKELVENLTSEVKHEASKKALLIENEAKEDAEKKAKRIISLAMARYAGEYAANKTMHVVELPSDEMKGRIIGREGRNIRALEAACGVDLVVDDTPEMVVISAFDPVRREVARRSIDRLMEDGRVHPARIEEVVDKVKSDLFKSIKEDGNKACFELGIAGVDPEIIKLIGSLKYRTSYTQNNYTHSIEVGYLAGMMAAELGVNVKDAKRAGLLHDIGKALDHSIEGGHAVIGAEFAKRHGENERICHAIRSHHEDEKPKTSLAHLVQTADALSSARPGARKQMQDNYIQRLEDMESIGNSFDGVIRTFAIQAGRELRVMVESSKVTDEQCVMLSRDIARKVEREMNYPGQVKVTVMRETRAIDHAR